MRVDTFSSENNDWAKLEDAARRAEALGFDGFAIPEITGDPLLNAAIVARATDRIQARTAIAVAFPRSPMVVAEQAWSIQVNSKGRFALGLGTQIKAHNELRFSTRWDAPRSRMIEYVEALRAIWRCWELGERLSYSGKHYRFSLMTPEFTPPKSNLPMVPIYLAAVRPKMIESAAAVADGLRLHFFCTEKYLREVTWPAIERGLDSAGRSRSELEVCGGGFIITGADEEALMKGREWVRYRVAFYGSTPSYLPVMSLHGWDDLASKLNRMTKNGQWAQMAAEVPDDVLDEFGVFATYDALPEAIEERFGGISDTVEFGFGADIGSERARDVLGRVHRIESPFQAHADHYA
ncbi:MAG: TIGR03617 family F420-dependent LLM class oxidoreductase [Myxococcales bacterium]|jgi:probable F420-dependent oxidoreductase